MRTSNPTLSRAFQGLSSSRSGELMTVQGTVTRSLILLGLVMLSASWIWSSFLASGEIAAVTPWIWIGAIGGFVCAIVLAFKREWASFLAPMYALLEGLFLGAFSSVMELAYPGIVFQAVGLTFGVFFALLFAYKARIIQATDKFKMGIVAATGGIAIVYFVSLILSFFGIHLPFIFGAGPFGIGFSLVVVVIAALNLVLDFDLIEDGARRGAPKYMEWYGAFALMVTLVWLYLEIVRLLAKLRQRD